MAAPMNRRSLLRAAAIATGLTAMAVKPGFALAPNPADYVHGLAGLGVRFSPGRPGRWLELEPERMAPADHAEAFRLRAFWMATPERRRMVFAELGRRWPAIG